MSACRTLLTALVLSHAADAAAFQRVFSESTVNLVSPVFEYTVSAPANSTITFSTDTLTDAGSCAADTVLHVYIASNGTWLASNDDCAASFRSCVTVTTGGTTSTLRIVGHAFSSCSTANARFHITGGGIPDPNLLAVFGGQVLTTNVGWSAGDRIHGVNVNNGLAPGSTLRLYALTWPSSDCSWNAVRLHKWSVSGIAGTRMFDVSTASSTHCKVRLLVGTSLSTDMNASARVLVNDLGADQDADGLGSALEDELQTCAHMTPVQSLYCGDAVNPRDSDRDGLSDDKEVLGAAGSPSLPLPRWGANPRQKDVFLESDWDTTSGNTGIDPLALFTLADAFQNTGGDPHNPNEDDGLQLHLDIGVDSCDTNGDNCSTFHGTWGGAAGVPTSDYALAADTHMNANRRGIFRYALNSGYGGGQASGWRIIFGTQDPVSTGRALAHEIGHTLGLSHGGEEERNCKPNYPSLMNYAYSEDWRVPSLSVGASASLNPVSLSEQNGIGGPNDILTDAYDFELGATTQVDWNRNGLIESGTVAGVSRYANSGSCNTSDLHSEGRTPLVIAGAPNASTTNTGALEFFGDLYAFYRTTSSALAYATLHHPLAPCFNPGPSTSACCSTNMDDRCGTWSSGTVVSTGAPLTSSVAVTRRTVGSYEYVAVVYSRGSGTNRRFFGRLMNSTETFTGEVQINITGLRSGGPLNSGDASIVTVGPYYHLFYLDSNNRVRRATLDVYFGVVANDPIFSYPSGAPFAGDWPPAAAVHPDGTVYLAKDTAGFASEPLYLYRQVGPNNFDAVSSANGEASGRPALWFDSSVQDGWELWYPDADGVLFRTWSVGNDDLDHESHAKNQWANDAPGGTTLTSYQGVLQALQSANGNSSDGDVGLRHSPFATGVFAFPDHDNDDWYTVHERMCEQVLAPTGNCELCNSSCPLPGTPVDCL